MTYYLSQPSSWGPWKSSDRTDKPRTCGCRSRPSRTRWGRLCPPDSGLASFLCSYFTFGASLNDCCDINGCSLAQMYSTISQNFTFLLSALKFTIIETFFFSFTIIETVFFSFTLFFFIQWRAGTNKLRYTFYWRDSDTWTEQSLKRLKMTLRAARRRKTILNLFKLKFHAQQRARE